MLIFGRRYSTPLNTQMRLAHHVLPEYAIHHATSLYLQGLDFDGNQRIDSRRDSRHTIAARIKVHSRERYHDSKYLGLYFDHFFLVTNHEHSINKNVWNKFKRKKERDTQQFFCICLIMYPAISLQIVIYNTGIPQLEHDNVISYIDHSDWL